MKTYKATIIPIVSGGNIEVKISANSVLQAQELIKTLSYFKSFAKMPFVISESETCQTQHNDDDKDVNEFLSIDELDID